MGKENKKPTKAFKIDANEKIDEAIKQLTEPGDVHVIALLEEAKKLNEQDQKEAVAAIEGIAQRMGEDGQKRLVGSMAVVIQTLRKQVPPALSDKLIASVQKALARMDVEATQKPDLN